MIEEQPLDANSYPIFPVPAKSSKSLTLSKSIKLLSILNRLSFAKSVVGLTGKFFGAKMDFPLYFPPIIRTNVDVKGYSIRDCLKSQYLDLA